MRIRVLVFGAAGVGKTSLCNVLAGAKRATDNGPLGVTAKSHLYAPFRRGEHVIELIDTVGLHESVHGTVPAEKAVEQLIELLHKSRDGFSLLIHVARAGRITQSHDQDHEFFVEKLTQQRVPTLLAITGCENEEPMSSWAERHGGAYVRFGYAELLPTCFAEGGRLETHFADLRQQSRESLLNAILRNATSQPVLLYGGDTGRSFNDLLARVWNEFVALAGLPAKYRRDVQETAIDFLRRVGVPKKVRDAMTKHIPDLLGELGDKTPVPYAGTALKYLSRRLIERVFGKEAKN